MGRRVYYRKFSCRLHVDGFKELRELRRNTPERELPRTNAWFIALALAYLNDNSPYGVGVNGQPLETPYDEHASPFGPIPTSERPVLRLVPRATGKES